MSGREKLPPPEAAQLPAPAPTPPPPLLPLPPLPSSEATACSATLLAAAAACDAAAAEEEGEPGTLLVLPAALRPGGGRGAPPRPPVGLMRMASPRSSPTLAPSLLLLLLPLTSLERSSAPLRPLPASSKPSPRPRSPTYSCLVGMEEAGRLGRLAAREGNGVPRA